VVVVPLSGSNFPPSPSTLPPSPSTLPPSPSTLPPSPLFNLLSTSSCDLTVVSGSGLTINFYLPMPLETFHPKYHEFL